ncbi:MAG: diaminopimelate decarboxylase, partial [Rhodospirillales bacterium]
MSYFDYQNGELNAERVPISRIASQVGTPFYCYSASTIELHYAAFADALNHMQSTICYAVKANSNIAVIRTLAQLGAGADVVSDGELIRALEAGVPPKKIVFSGVGKTASELALALEKDILQINIESEPELERLNEVTQSLGKSAQVAFRINPNVDAGSHDKISTGRQEDKFGIEWPKVSKVFSQATEMEYIEPIGLAVHIGSQLTDLVPFRSAFLKLHDLATGLMAEGFEIKRLDVGGGLGISYDGSPVSTSLEYAQLVSEILGDLNCDLLFEPGRVIIGDAGILVTKVIYVKKGPTRTFLIVDAAMNDFLRPSLYGAQHEILPI